MSVLSVLKKKDSLHQPVCPALLLCAIAFKKERHLIKLHIKQGICNVSCNMSRYVPIFHRSHLCAEPRRRVDGLENGDPTSSHPVCFHLVLSGHRAAEEGGEKVGQEVQVDEHEGGVRPSLLCSLAQPLHGP